MCDAGFGLSQAFERPALLMLGAAGALMRVGKKLSCSNFIAYIDTQGRSVHGPDERGLERLFIHNVKLYNCAAGMCGNP